MKATALAGDALLDRFLALRRWLRGLGVCWTCSDTFAFAQCEREQGDKGVKVIQECNTRQQCRDAAGRGRGSMPGRPDSK